jgi:hypothetical protein
VEHGSTIAERPKPMDIQKILAELREQRDQVAAVIEALERISFQQKPRRGRPPKWLTVNRINASRNGNHVFLNGSVPLIPQKTVARNATFKATGGESGD